MDPLQPYWESAQCLRGAQTSRPGHSWLELEAEVSAGSPSLSAWPPAHHGVPLWSWRDPSALWDGGPSSGSLGQSWLQAASSHHPRTQPVMSVSCPARHRPCWYEPRQIQDSLEALLGALPSPTDPSSCPGTAEPRQAELSAHDASPHTTQPCPPPSMPSPGWSSVVPCY